jgi:hypothetical protein
VYATKRLPFKLGTEIGAVQAKAGQVTLTLRGEPEKPWIALRQGDAELAIEPSEIMEAIMLLHRGRVTVEQHAERRLGPRREFRPRPRLNSPRQKAVHRAHPAGRR